MPKPLSAANLWPGLFFLLVSDFCCCYYCCAARELGLAVVVPSRGLASLFYSLPAPFLFLTMLVKAFWRSTLPFLTIACGYVVLSLLYRSALAETELMNCCGPPADLGEDIPWLFKSCSPDVI